MRASHGLFWHGHSARPGITITSKNHLRGDGATIQTVSDLRCAVICGLRAYGGFAACGLGFRVWSVGGRGEVRASLPKIAERDRVERTGSELQVSGVGAKSGQCHVKC